MVELIDRPGSSSAGRKVGAVVVVAIVLISVFAALKHFSMGSLADSEVEAAHSAVNRAIEGEEGAWREADEAWKDATSVSVLDYYPAFGLAATRRLQEFRSGSEVEKRPGDEVLRELLERDWDGARQAVDAMRDDSPERAGYYDRFVENLRQESMKAE